MQQHSQPTSHLDICLLLNLILDEYLTHLNLPCSFDSRSDILTNTELLDSFQISEDVTEIRKITETVDFEYRATAVLYFGDRIHVNLASLDKIDLRLDPNTLSE